MNESISKFGTFQINSSNRIEGFKTYINGNFYSKVNYIIKCSIYFPKFRFSYVLTYNNIEDEKLILFILFCEKFNIH